MLHFLNATWLQELRRAATDLRARREELLPDGFQFPDEGTGASSDWAWVFFPIGLLLVLLLWGRFYPYQLRYSFLA